MKTKNRNVLLAERKIEYLSKYRSIAVDYLNLVFGRGKES